MRTCIGVGVGQTAIRDSQRKSRILHTKDEVNLTHFHVLHLDDLEQLMPSMSDIVLGPTSAERWSRVVVLTRTASEATSSSSSTARVGAPGISVGFLVGAHFVGVCAGTFGCGGGGGGFLLTLT
ncbi:hypothetical protein BCV69DRAFT_25517 [Microstroma glucosiphilum]|uniref:Uncharacterized protein n=1 Tax=Pseudomicrostroma glucosiphilum TaxID=1684307 RepID=A0A316UHB0_9BASI|nr:hypothetical protein BCV69DRAFT_25517 [Pseudomicrostroma glucosiphilum]PWN24294.1 hypothetical protein BCV69DRAFT_25517 [Pseudomicrostroma glucosiphilum]